MGKRINYAALKFFLLLPLITIITLSGCGPSGWTVSANATIVRKGNAYATVNGEETRQFRINCDPRTVTAEKSKTFTEDKTVVACALADGDTCIYEGRTYDCTDVSSSKSFKQSDPSPREV